MAARKTKAETEAKAAEEAKVEEQKSQSDEARKETEAAAADENKTGGDPVSAFGETPEEKLAKNGGPAEGDESHLEVKTNEDGSSEVVDTRTDEEKAEADLQSGAAPTEPVLEGAASTVDTSGTAGRIIKHGQSVVDGKIVDNN